MMAYCHKCRTILPAQEMVQGHEVHGYTPYFCSRHAEYRRMREYLLKPDQVVIFVP